MLKNGFYNFAAAIARPAVSILTIPLVISFIGLEEYGLWTLVSTTLVIVELAEGGLSVSTTVFLSQDLANEEKNSFVQTLTISFCLILLLAVLAGLSIFFFSDSLVEYFPKLEYEEKRVATLALKLGIIVICSRLFKQILTSVEQAYQQYGAMNLLNTAQIFLLNLGSVLVVSLGGKTIEITIWYAAINIVFLVAHIYLVKKILRSRKLHWMWNWQKSKAIAKYSFTTWLTVIGGVMFGQFDRLIVGAFLGNKILAIYGTITSIAVNINVVSAMAVQPLLPSLTKILAQNKPDRSLLVKQLEQGFRLNSSVALGLGGSLFVLAPLAIAIVIPNGATPDNIWAFRLATIVYSCYSLNAVGFHLSFSVNLVNTCLILHLICGSLSLLAIAFGAKNFGTIGAILGNSIYMGTLLINYFSMKKIDLKLKTWLSWLAFPALWYAVSISIAFVFPDNIIFSILFAIVQLFILGYWFIRVNKIDLKNKILKIKK
jgi:O-antigen/teichoic acid export membrane protein